jgi:hypothetical protein
MVLRTRRLIALGLFIIFLISGPLIALYAMGWRLNLKTLKIEKTGAILLKTKPAGAAVIILDNKILKNKEADQLFIANLLPKKYSLEIIKADYRPWKKEISVKSSLVTETAAILIPAKKPAPVFNWKIADFFLQESEGQLVWRDFTGDFFLTSLTNYDSALNISRLFTYLKQTQLNFPGYVPLVGIEPAENADQLIISTEKSRYRLDIKKFRLELWNKTPPLSADADSKSPFILQNGRLYFQPSGEDLSENNLIAAAVKKYSYDKKAGRLYLLIENELGYFDF